MDIRIFAAAGLAFALAGCTTVQPMKSDPVAARWVGQSAGKFFAAYGPPIADRQEGSLTVYSWKGGYKTVRVPVNPAAAGEGKKKAAGPTRTLRLRCAADVSTGDDYVIRSIRTLGDMPGVSGPSYCAELLAPEAVAAAAK